MARSVTGLFATWEQVDSVDGALRDAGNAAGRRVPSFWLVGNRGVRQCS